MKISLVAGVLAATLYAATAQSATGKSAGTAPAGSELAQARAGRDHRAPGATRIDRARVKQICRYGDPTCCDSGGFKPCWPRR